jgi:hypothetical protein
MKPPLIESSPARMSEKYDRDRLSFLLRAAQEYGPVVELAPRTILISGYREAFEVLTNSNRKYLSTQNFLREPPPPATECDEAYTSARIAGTVSYRT